MSASSIPLLPTETAFDGGVLAIAGQGQSDTITISGNWLTEDSLSITLFDTLTGLPTLIGAGEASGIHPNYCFTFTQKEYVLSGAVAYFSAVGDPTTWNDVSGTLLNGYVAMSDYYASPETLVAIAPYQGRLVFFARRVTQIWIVDAQPTNWELSQVLDNIGTMAPLSVRNIGDLDVFFLSDTGIRSVRARDITLNAFVNDLGSPIDQLIQTAMEAVTPTQLAAACGVVEPTSNRYWLYLNGVIYVFSYFPSSKVQAWSTYSPIYESLINAPAANYTASVVTYTGLTIGATYTWTPGAHEVSTSGAGAMTSAGTFVAATTSLVVNGSGAAVTFTGVLNRVVTFVPSKFVVYNGQIYVRANDAVNGDTILVYGGPSNVSYDYSVCTATQPWFDLDDPSVRKTATAIDYALKGMWQLFGSMDYAGVQAGGSLQAIDLSGQPSFQNGEVPFSDDGYHIQLSASTTLNTAATLSSLVFHFEVDEAK